MHSGAEYHYRDRVLEYGMYLDIAGTIVGHARVGVWGRSLGLFTSRTCPLPYVHENTD